RALALVDGDEVAEVDAGGFDEGVPRLGLVEQVEVGLCFVAGGEGAAAEFAVDAGLLLVAVAGGAAGVAVAAGPAAGAAVAAGGGSVRREGLGGGHGFSFRVSVFQAASQASRRVWSVPGWVGMRGAWLMASRRLAICWRSWRSCSRRARMLRRRARMSRMRAHVAETAMQPAMRAKPGP